MRLKYDYSVISVIVHSLLGKTENRELTDVVRLVYNYMDFKEGIHFARYKAQILCT